jgi:hypothetical protein
MPPAPSRILRISTETLPERDRFSAFQEEFAQKILKMNFIDRSARRPRIEVALIPLGPVAVGAGSCTPAEFIRYNHHLKDCSDGFRLDIVARGPFQLSHAGEKHTYYVGWIRLDRTRGFAPCGLSNRNVTVRAAALKTLVAHPEDSAGHPVRPGPALGLLDSYLRSLTSLDAPPSSELAPIIGGHLLDLVAAVLGPTAEAAEFIAKRGVKAARLRAILSEVARRFSESDFDLDNVAGALGLSRRYIQRTPRGDRSPTVSRRGEAAGKARSAIRAVRMSDESIATVAHHGHRYWQEFLPRRRPRFWLASNDAKCPCCA